jgi:hypothetical protein
MIRKVAKADLSRLITGFRKNRKQIVGNFLLVFLFFVLALLAIGLRLLYPYHAYLAGGLLLLAIIWFLRLIWLYKESFAKFYTLGYAKKFYDKFKWPLWSTGFFLTISAIFFTIFPFDQNPFAQMSTREIVAKVEIDFELAFSIYDHFEYLEDQLATQKPFKGSLRSWAAKKSLLDFWREYLLTTQKADSLINTYRYYHLIAGEELQTSRSRGFLIGYSLFVKKQQLMQQIISQVEGNEEVRSLLNAKIEPLNSRNWYQELSEVTYHPATILRVNIGRIYLNNYTDVTAKELLLLTKTKAVYQNLKSRTKKTLANSLDVGMAKLETNLFDAWFPVQKGFMFSLSKIYLSDRNYKLITPEQIEKTKSQLEPGDILLQRRNWHATNLGIPGFWGHSAIYTGSLAELDNYFQELFPTENYSSYSQYLRKEFPQIFTLYQTKDFWGQDFATIEARGEGVILRPLEYSADADYLAAVRPEVGLETKFRALEIAYQNFGKPYDYEVDFSNQDQLVCAELIQVAYEGDQNQEGIEFISSVKTGRKIVSPNNIAATYLKGNQQLSWVLFLDASEETERAFFSDEKGFRNSIDRAKYSLSGY